MLRIDLAASCTVSPGVQHESALIGSILSLQQLILSSPYSYNTKTNRKFDATTDLRESLFQHGPPCHASHFCSTLHSIRNHLRLETYAIRAFSSSPLSSVGVIPPLLIAAEGCFRSASSFCLSNLFPTPTNFGPAALPIPLSP